MAADAPRSKKPFKPAGKNALIADRKGSPVGDVMVVVLDRPRHEQGIAAIRAAGGRVRLIPHGDVSAALLAVTERSPVDLLWGIGGTPEGVISAAAVKCVGGELPRYDFLAYHLPECSQMSPPFPLARGEATAHVAPFRLPSDQRGASLVCLVILSCPVFAGLYCGSGSRLGGVAWACRWKPAPSAAPRARWGRLAGSVQVVLTCWSRVAARGRGGRAVLACPSGRWPPRGERGGEGAVRRLGARCEVVLRGVGPAWDRSRPEA